MDATIKAHGKLDVLVNRAVELRSRTRRRSTRD